jgi:hypothetical protein
MSPFAYIISGAALLLALLLIWLLRLSSRDERRPWTLENGTRSHIQYFPQIQQALAAEDHEFLVGKGHAKLARAVSRERSKVVLDFLVGLCGEFDHLMRLARVIASLSPKVAPVQEFERLRLHAIFLCRVQIVRAKLAFGAHPLREISGVSNVVSGLAVRMELAMKELGAQAALAAELASAPDGNDIDLG